MKPFKHFHLYSDGSGHEDGFGGWAFRLVDPETQQILAQDYGGRAHTEVFAMEFEALLKGLFEVSKLRRQDEFAHVFTWHLTWFTDCEGLVKLLQEVPPVRSQSNPPLHALEAKAHPKYMPQILSFAYGLKELAQFTASQHPREEGDAHFQWCDLQASSMRLVFKSFAHAAEA